MSYNLKEGDLMTQIFVVMHQTSSGDMRNRERHRVRKTKRESRETRYDERDTMRGWSNSELGEVT